MKPVALALDMLQRENSIYTGYLLPTLHQTVNTLNELQDVRQFQFCLPLIRALTAGILRR